VVGDYYYRPSKFFFGAQEDVAALRLYVRCAHKTLGYAFSVASSLNAPLAKSARLRLSVASSFAAPLAVPSLRLLGR